MTFFLGHYGKIKLRRKSSIKFESSLLPADVNTVLNRFGFDGSTENILTGDRLIISTTDARGLDFLPTSTWPDGGGTTQKSVILYCNINAMGGIRLFDTFNYAINNNRTYEYPLEAFAGGALPITVQLFESVDRLLGSVTGFTFNTDREALETTTMSDKFKRMFSAGLISGSGSIDCLFDVENNGISENSLLMLQLINRTDIGSEFNCFLQLTDSAAYPGSESVYYEFDAMVSRAGVDVKADQVISCVIDFVTTGEIRLIVGEPAGYVLKEDSDRIRLQQNLDFLLSGMED